MVLTIPLVSVSLATVALESCLYGAYLVLAITSISLLLRRNAKSHRARTSVYLSPSFLLAIGLVLTITGHWILTVDRSFLAFIYFENGAFPLGLYADVSHVTEVVKTAFLMATMALGDALIIHRLWIVWGGNKYVVIFPICTWLGLIACGIGNVYQFTKFQTGQDIFLSEAGRWITSNATFTLCKKTVQIFTALAAFIFWRLWDHTRTVQPYGGSNQSIKSLLSMVVESAAIYTSWSVFFVATYESQSNLQFIAIDCLPTVAGIACMLIHVRVGLGWAQEEINNSLGGVSSALVSAPPLAVNISRRHDTTTDFEYRLDEFDRGDNKV
ncbi:hypothetical protein K438DRAFT_1953260 [Mycena galopus ATCC 62051]|nr:hypothetical protein K438DRAFT_1953260 [Mycena galopus ATCC 62051]